jgi:hypothetical protein
VSDEPCVCDTDFTCMADVHLDDTQEFPAVTDDDA